MIPIPNFLLRKISSILKLSQSLWEKREKREEKKEERRSGKKDKRIKREEKRREEKRRERKREKEKKEKKKTSSNKFSQRTNGLRRSRTSCFSKFTHNFHSIILLFNF